MSEEEINVHHKMDNENSASYSEAISEEVNIVHKHWTIASQEKQT